MTDRRFCVGCERLDMCSLEPLSRHCALKAKMKAETYQTNGDRLRAMSDGELAKFMVRNTCAVYSSPEDCDYSCDGFETCYDSWLDWLQSPAEGGGEDG